MTGKYLVLIAAAVGIAGCSKPASDQTKAAPKVAVVVPEVREVLEYEDLPGRVEAINSVEIKARVTGYLNKVEFKEGAEVPVGALLYSIDAREYQAVYDSAVAAWQQAQARQAQAKSDYTRAEQLIKSTVIAKQELETRGTDVLAAEAQVRSAVANVNKAKLNLDFCEVRAPIAGKISRTNITEGNLVANGDTLTKLVSQDPVYVYLDAPERVVLRWDKLVKNAAKEGFSGKVRVAVGLLNEEGFPREGVVDFTDNELSTGTGSLQLRAVLPNPDRSLRVGLYARVRMLLDQPRRSLLIPERAVGVDQGQRFVYLVNKENKVEYRRVVAGQIYGNKLAILDGLKEDDRIVVEGLQVLRPGLTVDPITEPEEPKAASLGVQEIPTQS